MSDITKLPKWAQERIKELERERDLSIRALNEFKDEQTVSPIYYEDAVCTGEQAGPSFKRRYIQTNKLTVEYEGVSLDILLSSPQDNARDLGIHLNWSQTQPARSTGLIAMVPRGYQSICLISPKNLR